MIGIEAESHQDIEFNARFLYKRLLYIVLKLDVF